MGLEQMQAAKNSLNESLLSFLIFNASLKLFGPKYKWSHEEVHIYVGAMVEIFDFKIWNIISWKWHK